jgi:C1A family cysteine protease
MPKINERELGGHAVLAVGYDDDTRQLTVRNSWGASWGQKGYFRMPYGYIENASLSDDFWTIRKEASK